MAAEAKIEITASTSRLPAGLRSALKSVQGFVTATTGMFGKQKRDLDERSIARGAAFGGVASSLAMRGIDVMVGQAKEVMTFERELTKFGIATRTGGAGLRDVAAAARQVSNETGKSALEVLQGGKAYSDLAGAQNFTIEKMRLMARTATATGAETKDLAGVMYQLTTSMGITDVKVMEETMGGLANQAKDGAIEFREMSKEFAGLMPLAKRYGLTGREGAIQIGAMYQVVRDGSNTAAEAATAMQRILAGIPSHASKFEKAGVKVWNVAKNGTKTLKGFKEIRDEIQKSELMKDPEKLKKAFGRTEGWQGFTLLIEQLVRLGELEKSGRVNGVITEDMATQTESNMGRIDIAIERLKNRLAGIFTPERIDALASFAERGVEALGPLIDRLGSIIDLMDTIAEMGGWVRDKFTGGEKFNKDRLTFEEGQLLMRTEMEQETGTREMSGTERARGDTLVELKRSYEKAIKRILSKEKDHRPTDASVAEAYRAFGEGGGAAEFAGQYFTARKDNISERRHLRGQKTVADERKQRSLEKIDRDIALGLGQSTVNGPEGIDNFTPSVGYAFGGGRGPELAPVTDLIGPALEKTWGPRLDAIVRLLGDQKGKPVKLELKLDDNSTRRPGAP